jgi:ubiquinol-cytochrome c reductase cytochrome c1 subunit
MKTILALLLCIFSVLATTGRVIASEGGAHIELAGVNTRDIAAVQRGAKWFVNSCHSCHSASYMRYNRLVEDLDLSEEMVMQNLVFSEAKIGDTMDIAMKPEQAEEWFGKVPPDLSLIARSRGTDWLFSYLKNFYRDENGRWNNLNLPNAAMPHVLWQLQGIQKPVYETEGEMKVVDHLVLEQPGLQTPEEYDTTVRDIVTFLDYMSEPAKLERKSLGIWVMLFLVVFAGLTYALKAEFWRDVH